jgi:hypothetical protein
MIRSRPQEIPNYPDLRVFDLIGWCRCHRLSHREDIHTASCPHQKFSKSMLVLEWR